MNKTIMGVIITLIILALIFVAVVLIMGSVHGLSFVEEIKSWFETAKENEPIIEGNIESIVNMFKKINW